MSEIARLLTVNQQHLDPRLTGLLRSISGELARLEDARAHLANELDDLKAELRDSHRCIFCRIARFLRRK